MKNKYEGLNEQLNGQMQDNASNSTNPETFNAEFFAEENADWMNPKETPYSKVSVIPPDLSTAKPEPVNEMIQGAVQDDHFTKDVEDKLRNTLTQKWTLATRMGNPSLYRFAKAHSKQMLAIGSKGQQEMLRDMLTAKRAAMNLLIASKLRRAAATLNRQTKEWLLTELNKAHEAQRHAEKAFLQMIEEDLGFATKLSTSSRTAYETHLFNKRTRQLQAFEEEAVYTEHAMALIAKIPGVK